MPAWLWWGLVWPCLLTPVHTSETKMVHTDVKRRRQSGRGVLLGNAKVPPDSQRKKSTQFAVTPAAACQVSTHLVFMRENAFRAAAAFFPRESHWTAQSCRDIQALGIESQQAHNFALFVAEYRWAAVVRSNQQALCNALAHL